MAKAIYTFGDGKAEGNAGMRNLLGGKGANLAEMNLLGMPVPPGFTITTDVCTEYTQYGRDKVVADIKQEVENAIAHVENLTGKKFNDPSNPLLVSVRSGARASMPGMMDTVLNLGMNDATVETMAVKSGNPRFAWDSYRRFVQMYGDVVLGMKPKSKTDIDPFEAIMDKVKEGKGIKFDNELDVDDLKELVKLFKAAVKDYTGKDFPESAWEQLWGGICAVFDSWMNERAILYRRMNQIPEEWGTAVNVQAMVYGNMGNNSATGVAFSRDAATGENIFNGEYLINAQGEDVVAGVRTPSKSLLRDHVVGPPFRESASRIVLPNIPLLRNQCQFAQQNLSLSLIVLKTTTATCKIWSSPFRTANSGCSRPATASVRGLPWCA